MPQTMKVSKGEVKVRMYRHGFGDCLLLGFHGSDNHPRYMLIDCGALETGQAQTDEVRKVATDIAAATGGHLHVLAVTHEHMDHISGFWQAEDIFAGIKVDQVWFGWPENAEDGEAQELLKLKHAYTNALHGAAKYMAAQGMPIAERMAALLGFAGFDRNLSLTKGTGEIMDILKGREGVGVEYCEPGTVRTIPGAEDIRILVLGPPRESKLIRKSRPSQKHKETYLTDCDPYDFRMFRETLACATARAKGEPAGVPAAAAERRDEEHPFDNLYRRPMDRTDPSPFIKDHYLAPSDLWRSIDDRFLEAAGDLAIRLDEHTNNTSLVLAFEIAPTDKVLLFTGDAQVGNWLGWEDYAPAATNGKSPIEDILARAVLYKVGHHGSHNATLREKGLELMTGSNLVAMIPVVQTTAEGRGWSMPFQPLLDRLVEKCRGRVLRLDDGKPSKPAEARAEDWKTFDKRVTQTDLYLEISVK